MYGAMARLVARAPHQPVDGLVVGVLAVAHVEAGHVHAGVHQVTDALGGGHRRAEGADDLCSTHTPTLADL